jgi:hypothetical protein
MQSFVKALPQIHLWNCGIELRWLVLDRESYLGECASGELHFTMGKK